MSDTFQKPSSSADTHYQYLRELFHDLRGPLASIQKSAEISLADLGRAPESEIRELLAIIKGESERLLEFLTLKLEAETFDRGAVSLKKSAFELSKFLEINAPALQEELGGGDCRVDFHDSGSPIWVEADEVKILRLLRILGQSLAARGGALEIGCKKNEALPSARIWIRVSGDHRNPSPAGPGPLALQVANAILKLHGTTLEAEEHAKRGFSFNLFSPPNGGKTPVSL